MQIRTRFSMSADGYVTTPDGWPFPAFQVPQRCWRSCESGTRGADVHLVGGPRTIETFRGLGALDKLGLLVLPCTRRATSSRIARTCSRAPHRRVASHDTEHLSGTSFVSTSCSSAGGVCSLG